MTSVATIVYFRFDYFYFKLYKQIYLIKILEALSGHFDTTIINFGCFQQIIVLKVNKVAYRTFQRNLSLKTNIVMKTGCCPFLLPNFHFTFSKFVKLQEIWTQLLDLCKYVNKVGEIASKL